LADDKAVSGCLDGLDPLGVFAGATSGVVAYQDRLAERDSVCDGRDGIVRSVCILGAFVAVFAEAFASLLGSLDQGRIFIVNLSAHCEQKIFTLPCPHGRIETLGVRQQTQSKLLPVTVTTEPNSVTLSGIAPVTAGSGSIDIELPGRAVISVEAGVDPELVRTVLGSLLR
jgi:hypothetical protein